MRLSHKHILKRRKMIERRRITIESTQLKAFHSILTKETIRQICSEQHYYFRNRLLTPFVTIFHMLQAAMSFPTSFQSAWHNIGEIGNSGSLSKSRQRLPLSVWQALHKWTTDKIHNDYESTHQWRGHRLVGVDGTCVSMSDEDQLTSVFGKPGSKHGKGRFPVARIVFAFTIKTMISIAHQVDAYAVGENNLFSKLLKVLNPGDLIIADRRYAGAKLYVDYKRAGIDFITRKHQRLKVETLKIISTFGKNDFLVKLPISRVYCNKDLTLPESIRVRMIRTDARIRSISASLTSNREHNLLQVMPTRLPCSITHHTSVNKILFSLG